jgi:proton-dependent oligopeptide transporter, POT family
MSVLTAQRTKRGSGFTTLFVVDLWERFSFFGMSAILVLYLTAPDGLGMAPQPAAGIFGGYLALSFIAGLPGGWIADRVLGPRNAVLLGGSMIAAGHLVLAVPESLALYCGLFLVAGGTGLVKPAMAALVAATTSGDHSREAMFSFFYMSIQVSALIAPVVVGVLAEKVSWHLGFAAAAAGMALGLVQFTLGVRKDPERRQEIPKAKWTPGSRKRIRGYVKLMLASSVFWMIFAQSGSVLSVFAQQSTDRTVGGFEVPASWFQAAHPLFVLLIAPLAAKLWLRAGDKLSTPLKFAGALALAGLSFVLMAGAAGLEAPVSPWWLIAVYLLFSCGEVALAPVGLSLAVAVAPPGYESRFLGINGLFAALGVVIGGQLFRLTTVIPLHTYFLLLGGASVVVGAIVAVTARRLAVTLASR